MAKAARRRSSPNPRARAALAGAVAVLGMIAAGWVRFHPPVRLLNHSGQALRIYVDGKLAASVAPTSAEAPNAGLSVRVSSGTHVFSARGADGMTLDETTATVASGSSHLYAPAHGRFCFFVETDAYGSARPDGPRVEPLDPDASFYVLPDDLDAWFEPNPGPAEHDPSATGGVRRALRERPCR
jgi:hypothetical protein